MRRGGRLFIILGVGLALVAALLVVFSLTKNNNNKTPPVVQVTPDASVSVLQAAHDIPANTVIREEDVKVVKVDRGAAANGAATSASQVIGLATNGDVVSGQQILMANLVSPGLTNLLTNGKRAVALPVDRLSALGGMIRADDYIDIVYSARLNLSEVLPTSPISTELPPQQYSMDQKALELPPPGQGSAVYPIPGQPGSVFTVTDGGNGSPVTKVVMQNIRVLRVIAGNEAVNDSAFATPTPTPAPSGTATPAPQAPGGNVPTPLPSTDMLVLEVEPQQSELIKFLEDNQGRYQVVLRAPNDHATPTTTGMTYDQLMSTYGLPAPKPIQVPSGGQ